ncbi:MAG: hypothetical protein Q7K57_57195 [Burkholderiaceae bacterium]|nr:hypothetical protein [Burkholderiaceae bacterium]
MKTHSAPVLAALAAGSVAIVQLVHLAFATPIALNLSTWDLAWGGVTYKGAYGLGAISGVTDKPGEVQGITLELFGEAAMIALALDDADLVQGVTCTIRTAIIETATYTILDAPVEWVGTLDTMSIAEDGQQASIRVSAESKAVDILRGTPQFYNDTDQRAINAADGSFAYVVDQLDKPIVWPAKAYFYQ